MRAIRFRAVGLAVCGAAVASSGAGFSVLRLPMGASDDVSTPDYCAYCNREDPTLAGFSIDPDRRHVLPTLKEALRFNPAIRIVGLASE